MQHHTKPKLDKSKKFPNSSHKSKVLVHINILGEKRKKETTICVTSALIWSHIPVTHTWQRVRSTNYDVLNQHLVVGRYFNHLELQSQREKIYKKKTTGNKWT